jgi:hypothetical protein
MMYILDWFFAIPTYAAFAIMMSVIIVIIAVNYVLRVRAMRALALRWGLTYVGPPMPRLIVGYMPKIKPKLPFPRNWYPANMIRQAWNVVEGQVDGVPVVIFDSFIWYLGSHGQYLSFIACQAQNDPFEVSEDEPEIVTQHHGWTILYRVPRFLMNPFATSGMRADRIEHHLMCITGRTEVRASASGEPALTPP